jgi:hypothetical protein
MLDFIGVPDFHRFLVNGGVRCSDWCRCWLRRWYFTKEERSQGLDCGEFIGWASWTPSIAAVRRAVASRILSVAVIFGTGMAWWLYLKVSVMRLPPVSAIKTRMQR